MLSVAALDRLAGQFNMTRDKIAYWATVVAEDLKTGPFQHERELMAATNWMPEGADAFARALTQELQANDP